MTTSNNQFKTAIYIRLSKEDENKKKEVESESIANQRSLLLSYLQDHNFTLTKEYVDDGYSGTTFDRPAFNCLIKDIESNKINMVVTKDLSRLGRDYIQSGYYLEQYFPIKKVRYISVLDNVDTFQDTSNNDIAPFKSLLNDMQSKDNSKKIRSILRNRKQQGYFLGSEPSFGYKKDPADKHKLILDKKTAPIVRYIFDLALQGESNSNIAKILNKERVITPTIYKKKKISARNQHPEIWTASSIYQILNKKLYTGTMVQGVQAKLNYKSKKRIILDQNQWIEVRNTHPAIITEEEFELVNRSSKRTKLKTSREKLLLEGLVFCKECQCRLSVRKDYRNKKKDHYIMNCNRYTRNSMLSLCSSHFTIYEQLETKIIERIKFFFTRVDKNKLLNIIEEIYEKETKQDKNIDINKLEKEKHELEDTLKILYHDKVAKNISVISYQLLAKDLETKLQSVKNDITELQKKRKTSKLAAWNKKINIEKVVESLINRDFIFQLIDRITVSKNKEIDIYYKFKTISKEK